MIRHRRVLALAFCSVLVVAACSHDGRVSITAGAGPQASAVAEEVASEPGASDDATPEPGASDDATPEPGASDVATPEPEVSDEPGGSADDLATARAYLDNDFIDTFDDDDADCIVIEMVDTLGLARLAQLDINGGPIDQGDIDALLDSMYRCVDAIELGTMLTAEMAGGNFAIPADARDCVIAGYGERSTVEALLRAGLAAEDPNAALAAEAAQTAIAPLVDCIGFGGLMKQEAAADGVTLSEETVACLDEDGNDAFAEVVGGILTGEAPLAGGDAQEEVLRLLLGCLSADEMTQMGN